MLIVTVLVVLSLFPMSYYALAERYARRYGVDVALVLAVIYAESGGNPSATSNKGAIGLMQLMPSTATWLAQDEGMTVSADDLLLPEVNIRLGTKYLAYLAKRFDGDYVLAAYNAGEGNVKGWLTSGVGIPFPETVAYVARVKLLKKGYETKLSLLRLVV